MDSILRRIFGWRSLSNIGTERLYYLLNALYKCLNTVCLGMDRSILSLGKETPFHLCGPSINSMGLFFQT